MTMPAVKNPTSVFSNSLTGNVVSASVARATGEGLLCAVWQETDFASVGSAGAPVWDAAGDNQPFTSVANQQEWVTVNRRLSLFVLPAPTTAKTAAVESTLTGGYGGATTHDRASMLVVRISAHDAADMIRASNARQESVPETNDLPNTVTSAVGDLVVFFGSVRENIGLIDAGDLSGYEEFSTAIGSRIIFVGTKAGAAGTTTGTPLYNDPTGQSNALIAVSIKAGAAPAPIITGPTGGTPGTTTITIGATSDSPSDGTMRFLRRVGGSAASDATIVSTGESQAATANPQSRAMTGFTASSVNNFVDMVQVGAGGNSNVLSYGPFTMAADGTAPSISVQPASQTVTAGAVATFNVTASGSGTLAYQWRFNGSNVGTNSSSYARTTVIGDNGGLVSVVVTGDTAPPATSSNATLTVNAAPGTFNLSVGPFGLNTGSGPLLGTAVSYTLTPGEVGAASGTSINGTGTFHASTGILAIGSIPAAGVYSVQVKNADGTGRWHDVATAT